jgi:large subunit ribosomal protein L24e
LPGRRGKQKNFLLLKLFAKILNSFRHAHGKELTVDSTLSFAARRNAPVRYNRDLVATTLKAMQRVSEIRARRERAFYKQRMKGNKERQRAADRKLVEENQHLLPPRERTVVDEMEVERVKARVEKRRKELEMDVEEEIQSEELEEEVKAKAPKTKRKLKMLRTGGVEAMDVDE